MHFFSHLLLLILVELFKYFHLSDQFEWLLGILTILAILNFPSVKIRFLFSLKSKGGKRILAKSKRGDCTISTKAVETPLVTVSFAEEWSCSKAGTVCAIATEELIRKFSW